MAVDILCVVEAVLPADLHVLVSEELVEVEADQGFLVGGPVAGRLASSHQRDANCVVAGPGETNAIDMASTSLNVEVEPDRGGQMFGALVEHTDGFDDLKERRADDELPVRAIVVDAGSHMPLDSAEIGKDDCPLGPLAKDCARGERRDDLDGVEGQEGTAPLENSPMPGQHPQGQVAHRYDDVGLHHLDLEKKFLVPLNDRG